MRMWKLIGPDGMSCLSIEPGQFGGHRRNKIFGRLDCPAALLALSKGGYTRNRVFFVDEATARSAGFRPCFRCMPVEYRRWKLAN